MRGLVDGHKEPIPGPSSDDASDDFFDVAGDQIRKTERELLIRDQQETTEQLRRLTEHRERLLMLLEISRSMNSTLSTQDVLDRVMDAALTISGAQRGFLVLLDSAGQLRLEISRNLEGPEEAAEDTFRISQSILRQAIDTGRTTIVSDALSNPAFTGYQSVRDLSLRTVVCLPLRFDQRVLGAIYLDSRSVSHILTGEGPVLLEALASQAAVAISNARTHDLLRSSQTRLEAENRNLKRALRSEFSFDSIIGRSPAMQRVFDVLEKVVGTSVTVLVTGETGTGKELIARALHNSSPRRNQSFVPVNCAALPEPLLESELFGYRRGAFTGASEDRTGLFEAAHGGTLFLDEIGDMPTSIQVKLLRVLQESEVRRLGETHSRRVDFRLVAATNRDLSRDIEEQRFRQDLYYRLNVVTINLPPLRERPEDLLPLAEHFLRQQAQRMNRPGLFLTSEAKTCLLAHSWPGNVRELENAVERSCALASGENITPEHLVPAATTALIGSGGGETLKDLLLRAERASIEASLRRTAGNVSRAAGALGVSRQHLHNRIRKLGIQGAGRP